ncbi:MAG: hypothetical protein ACKV2Q_33280 [Planctomycetaceae bacterium]
MKLTNLTLNKKPAVCVFDSQVRISYVREAACSRGEKQRLDAPRKLIWEGGTRVLESAILAQVVLDGQSLVTLAYVCNDLGCDESGAPIDLVIGSLTLKAWNVSWDADQCTLDFTRAGQIIEEFGDLEPCGLAA